MPMFRPPFKHLTSFGSFERQRPHAMHVFRGTLAILVIAGAQLSVLAATPQLAGGRGFSLALDEQGVLRAWGSNFFGELGDGSTIQKELPQVVGANYSRVTARGGTVFALKEDGSLWGWGSNVNGQLGTGNTDSYSGLPSQVGTGFQTVVQGFACNFGIKVDKSLWGWGTNQYGELGDGGGANRYTPAQIGQDFISVATGSGENSQANPIICYTLGLKSNGDLWAWGNNSRGQLGDGTTASRATPTLVDTGYRSVKVGVDATYGIKQDNTLWSWGSNQYGQLGDDSNTPKQRPTLIATDVKDVYPVGPTMFAIKSDGSLWGWGNNAQGQVGDGTREQRTSPVRIGQGFTQIVPLSDWSVYGLKTDGSLWAWGSNARGEFGDGTTTDRLIPARIGSGFHTVMALPGWESSYTLAMKTDGSLVAWGDNTSGNLGDGTTNLRMTPVVVLGQGFGTSIPIEPVDPEPCPASTPTFNGTTGVLHLPRVELFDTALRVDLQLVDAERLTLRVTGFSAATVAHDSNAVTMKEGLQLRIPSLRLADQDYWLILRLTDADTLTFQITDFGTL